MKFRKIQTVAANHVQGRSFREKLRNQSEHVGPINAASEQHRRYLRCRAGLSPIWARPSRVRSVQIVLTDLKILLHAFAKPLFQKLADCVADRDMHFLHPRRRFGWNAQTKIARRSHFAATFARKADDGDLAFPGRFDRAQNIHTVAAGRDRKKYIARPGVRGELAGKHVFIPVIVSNRRESRAVDVQRQGPKRLPLEKKSARKFCGDVLCIGRGSTVTSNEQLAAAAREEYMMSTALETAEASVGRALAISRCSFQMARILSTC